MFAALLGLVVIAWLLAGFIQSWMMRFGYVPHYRRPEVAAKRRAEVDVLAAEDRARRIQLEATNILKERQYQADLQAAVDALASAYPPDRSAPGDPRSTP